eukprot:m.2794 g.2794  ORF g.2794 m.2794 type:complete len:60 (-) comp2169_c0_seq1:311-490(-)
MGVYLRICLTFAPIDRLIHVSLGENRSNHSIEVVGPSNTASPPPKRSKSRQAVTDDPSA